MTPAPSTHLAVTIAALVLLLNIGCAQPSKPPADSKTDLVPEATIPWIATPQTDGTIGDGEYADALRVDLDGRAPNSNPGWNPLNDKAIAPDDLSYTLYVGHDGQYLYAAFDVTDNSISSDNVPKPNRHMMTVWDDDCAEICIDGDLDRDAATESSRHDETIGDEDWQEGFVPHYGIPDGVYFDDGRRAYGTGTEQWYARSRKVDDHHWQTEFRVPLALIDTKNGPGIVPAKPGDLIGFNALINDDDNGGPREQQLAWHGLDHDNNLYWQQRAWLIVKLAENKSEPAKQTASSPSPSQEAP